MDFQYENQMYNDPAFPIRFDLRILEKNHKALRHNWHEGIEIIYIINGSCTFYINSKKFFATKDDVIIINSNLLHSSSTENGCDYYYFIVNNDLFSNYEFLITNTNFKDQLRDPNITAYFTSIINEWNDKKIYYKSEIKADIIKLCIYLLRNYAIDNIISSNTKYLNQKSDIVKNAILLIAENENKPISLKKICDKLGYSINYFCRIFKEMTGQTFIEYMNILRCNKAKAMLSSGKYNISECAIILGFCSSSYFTKQYKKFMGELPSIEKKSNNFHSDKKLKFIEN